MNKITINQTRVQKLSFVLAFIGIAISIIIFFFALQIEESFSKKLITGFTGGALGFLIMLTIIEIRKKRRISKISNEINFSYQKSLFGIEGVFLGRRDTLLNKISEMISEEKHQLVLVATSFGGLLCHSYIKGILIEALNRGVKVNILLTHPKFLYDRNKQEGRCLGELETEFMKSLTELIKIREISSTLRVNLEVRLFKGSPTMFMIATSKIMVVSPYTHSSSAYEWPCFLIGRESPLFDTYMNSHFSKSWESSNYTSRISDNTQKARQDIIALIDDFSEKHGNLPELEEIKHSI